ncbi:hypothetical protein [Methylophaga sp. OBS1]|jgi:hypothetical protein|uniref:hypothetical protein n=1 Tax=Methylophaga sp. OBS1 TaxID=2991933 RepID=UPI002255F6CA|nr:hypothetical protein [Methylophaga sp. OBS1]MCX4191439.1 hypothetical protein [Methylophaga sp. OBS1]MCX4191617.1 hypothetical protein [Methylophaga sp. OBS1]
MSNVSIIGMVLYLILALFGGFLTGLFSRYAYRGAYNEFGRPLAVIFSIVFYIAPAWAVLSLFKDDDLDIFYLLLVVSFAFGVFYFNRIGGEESEDRHYHLPDEDER